MIRHLLPGIIVFLFFAFQKWLDPMMDSILRENDIEELIYGDIDTFMKKRLTQSRIVLVLLVFWPKINFSVFYFGMVILLYVLFFKKDYLKAKRERNKKCALLKFQFPIWLRQLQILLQTNTVSQSLILSLKHAPDLIQEDLKILIEEINKDALNIAPYLNFLKSYRLSEIERAMKLLYRYNTMGKEDSYLQFNRMIQTTTKWLRSEREEHHQASLAFYEWFSMIPLFGVTLLFIAIMCQVIMNMFSNGI